MTVFTVGHSTRSAERFVALLQGAGVQRVWDIRSFPGSRRYPHFNSETLAAILRSAGLGYEHHPELGGRRRPASPPRPSAWRNEGFRGYAEYMETDAFRSAIDRLIVASDDMVTAIMCSEAVPWRCHRSLVSDALTARDVDVLHILDDRVMPHTLTRFAMVTAGDVRYPLEASAELKQAELDLTRR